MTTKIFLPKLENIQNYFEFSSSNVKQIKILSDKYSKTSRKLYIILRNLTFKELKTCIECIARFENLKELKLHLGYIVDSEPIDDCLSLIGQKCNKLLKLDLSIYPEITISKLFLRTFFEFKAIKKLNIVLKHTIVLSGSVECFKHCKQLIDIDICYPELREDFFANIASFVPKLQSLRIITDQNFSDSFINSFNSMKFIQNVYSQTNIGYRNWCFGKCLSEVKASWKGKHVIRVNDNCGLRTHTYG